MHEYLVVELLLKHAIDEILVLIDLLLYDDENDEII